MLVTAVIALLAVVSLVYGYQRFYRAKPASGIENVQDLGNGFRQVTLSKMEKGQTNRYSLFYYKERLIGQIGAAPPSISPTGNYAVCHDIRSGKLVLFRRQDDKIVNLTPTAFGVPSGFVWNEAENTVEAKAGGEFSSIFNLQ